MPPGTPGAVRLRGRVLDGTGDPVPDAILELWQADAEGNVVQEPGSLRRTAARSPASVARRPTTTGRYSFTTVVPGAPFFALTVFARGLLNRLFTRAYLPEGRATRSSTASTWTAARRCWPPRTRLGR